MAARRLRTLGTGLAIAALAAGCSSGDEDLKAFVERIKQRPGGEIDPLPTFEPYESVTYDAAQLRDPFTPKGGFAESEREASEDDKSEGQAESDIAPDKDRPKEPLEQFSLDSLEMVGTLTRDGERWALVKDPDGTIHRVLPGNYMGQQYGRITAVKPDEIRLVEIIPARGGGWEKRDASIALSD